MQTEQLHHLCQPLLQHLLPHLHERRPLPGHRKNDGLQVPQEQPVHPRHLRRPLDHLPAARHPVSSVSTSGGVQQRAGLSGRHQLHLLSRHQPGHVAPHLHLPRVDHRALLRDHHPAPRQALCHSWERSSRSPSQTLAEDGPLHHRGLRGLLASPQHLQIHNDNNATHQNRARLRLSVLAVEREPGLVLHGLLQQLRESRHLLFPGSPLQATGAGPVQDLHWEAQTAAELQLFGFLHQRREIRELRHKWWAISASHVSVGR